jgi:hypothetical protein
MDVLYVSRREHDTANARRVLLDEVLQRSDVIFLALPESTETTGMISTNRYSNVVNQDCNSEPDPYHSEKSEKSSGVNGMRKASQYRGVSK